MEWRGGIVNYDRAVGPGVRERSFWGLAAKAHLKTSAAKVALPETRRYDRPKVEIEGGMRAAFWRFAHQHYHGRKPLFLVDVAAFTWFAFFALIYGAALLAGWLPDFIEALVGLFLIGGPLMLGVLHRRIRIEAAKSPDALYRKRLLTSR
ncbi:hypothetical protein AWL63_12155 [Sphingomonas panacis]|uniref:Uncharacterized protein n=2 Tax=Sphingomonas panacis TaxID=1560345 RepID=A0A1B3ZB20_9SPHN|nr:hypothetical protein AWL63_12155 [Sphingomonas panacis]